MKHFMKPESDLETSLESVLTMEYLTMSLHRYFYDGLGLKGRYLLDVASGGIFMSKFEDDVMELIKTVANNSHQNAAKPFGRGAMLKG